MIIPVSIILFVISFLMAIRSLRHEFTTPKEVVHMKIKKKGGVSGSILFLKSKVIHTSENSSSAT
jgi:hypothetical protein